MPDTYILFVHHIRFIRISKIWTQIFKRNFTVGVGIIERKHIYYIILFSCFLYYVGGQGINWQLLITYMNPIHIPNQL